MNVALIYPDNDQALEEFYDQYKLENNTVVKVGIQGFEDLSNSCFSEIPSLTPNELANYILEQLINKFDKNSDGTDLILLDESLNFNPFVESLRKWKECNIIVVNEFYKRLKKQVPNSFVVLPSDKSPREIAEEVSLFTPSVGLINIEGKYGNEKLQNLGGIEILLWLRVKHKVRFPIITLGYLSSQQILKKEPKHLVIHALGNLFVQLPFTTAHLSWQIEKIKSETKDINGIDEIDYRGLYKPFLKPAFSIEEFRHREANWWGIKCLWDIYKATFDLSETEFPYPIQLQNWLGEKNTSLAVFLAGQKTVNLQKELDKPIPGNNKITFKQSIKETIRVIRSRKIKVLHIDDQNKDGWCRVLRNIIYDPKTELNCQVENDSATFFIDDVIQLKSVGTGNLKDVDDFCDRYFDKEHLFKEADWDLILLDLRLFPLIDSKFERDFEKLSGAVILDLFKQLYKYDTTPILITSASNKIWTYEQMNKLGSDAYWMKEGIDNSFETEETVINFFKLIHLIEKLTDPKFMSLRNFSKWFDNFDIKNGWWVKNKSWKNKDIILADTNELEKLIGESIDHLRIYLQQFHLGFAYKSSDRSNSESYAISNIINKIGNVVEIIHNITDKHYKNDMSVGTLVRVYRGDISGEKIRQERHDASHRKYTKLNWYDLDKTLKMVQRYLSEFPLK